MEYFTELVETYKPTLTRDSRILLYLDKIGQKHFGVPAKDENYGGLLGNLLKGQFSFNQQPSIISSNFRNGHEERDKSRKPDGLQAR